MKQKIINVLKLVLFTSIGLLMVWLSIRNLDEKQKHDIAEAFKKADYSWILLSMLVGILSHISRAMRWNMLLKPLGYNPKTYNTFFAVMVGYFANFAVPRMGEVTRCGILTKYEKISLNEGFGTVIAERVIDVICLIVIFFLTLFLNFKKIYGFVDTHVFSVFRQKIQVLSQRPLVIVALIVFFVVMAASFFFFRKKAKGKLVDKIIGMLKGFIEGLKTVKNIKNPIAFIGHTFFIWGMYWLSIYLCLFCLPEVKELGAMDALILLVLGSIAVAMPVPGGIGFYQGFISSALVSLYAVGQVNAYAFPWLVWGSQFVLLVAIGLISLVLLAIINKTPVKNEQIGNN